MASYASQIVFMFIGIFCSVIIQKWDQKYLFDALVWLQNYYMPNSTSVGTSIALLTLVEQKKKSFSVAVLPTKEVATETDWILNNEVQSILNKAIMYKNQGKTEKALKLLKQCKALNPKHPDVLNFYGEGIESKDVITAEHHYALALVIQPGHLKATANRRRCLPRVKELDLKMLRRIEQKREALMKIPEGNSALKRAKLESYYKHIYHSNGIEGNTMTLSMTRSILETKMAVGGKSVLEHNEVLGMDAALQYINITLLNEIGPVTIQHMLQIHKRVLGYAQPLDAGLFRDSQVYVGEHIPPSPVDVHQYMEAFQRWLLSTDVEHLHPIELAALAHYKLVYIHPFTDGNGRTSRLLMNLFLMRAGYPPVIIRKEDRFKYYQHLQTANIGDVRPFIRFVATCTEETLDEYLSSVTVGKLQMQDPSDSAKKRTDIIDYKEECFNPFHQASSLTDPEDLELKGRCEEIMKSENYEE
eukprot:TCONS_00049247-protein